MARSRADRSRRGLCAASLCVALVAAAGTRWAAGAALAFPRPAAAIDLPGPFLTDSDFPGFRFKVAITAGSVLAGHSEAACIPGALCVSGALAGRPEVFVRLIGPRPNGYLWVQIVRFTPAQVDVLIERTSTGAQHAYRLASVAPGTGELAGLEDRTAFLPGAASDLRADPEAVPAGASDYPGDWITDPAYPDFRFKVAISETLPGSKEPACIPEALCLSGAVAGRAEVFLRLIGPRPNGNLWVQIVRFTPSRVDVLIEQRSTTAQRSYHLDAVPPDLGILSGFEDRTAFLPAGAPTIVFSPPTDLDQVAAIVPLGNLNPGGGHVLPVDHMYLDYLHPASGGTDVVPARAMADGELVMATRTVRSDISEIDYGLYIRHDAYVTSRFDHLYGLSSRLLDYLTRVPGAWLDPGGGFQMMFLGQLGAPVPLSIHRGEQVGITKSYSSNWDVGVSDNRVHRQLLGAGTHHFLSLSELAAVLGVAIHDPFPGDQTVNAACFLDYLEPAVRDAWQARLASTPKDCGRNDWDVAGCLRGNWFNPALDTAPSPPIFRREVAVLSIAPDNLRPLTHVQIGIGSGDALSALDPTDAHPQLDQEFDVSPDRAPGARINPDPANVCTPGVTVCYDLTYQQGSTKYNVLLFQLTPAGHLRIKYDPAPRLASGCAAALATEPTAWTTEYVR